jgi:hypothetical protein
METMMPDHDPDPEADPDYVSVRRPADAPFGVIPSDLLPGDQVRREPDGYDLALVRSVAHEGLTAPIEVQPIGGGRFRVVDGLKRLAAIRLLIRMNKVVYDAMRGIVRPARRVYSLVYCRIPRKASTPDEAGRRSPGPG